MLKQGRDLKHIIMGTAGHVDHGKTELIKALTGTDCDTHKEEKRRGITINLGFTHLLLSNGEKIGIIDVPGHRDFVNTMVSGVSSIDFAVLVVAADSGIMPQTREHLQIMNIIGLQRGIIAVTKTDIADPELIDLAEEELAELVKGTFLEACPMIRLSSTTGDGIDRLKQAIESLTREIPNRPGGQVFRLFIDRIFSVSGHGTVVTGTVTSGVLRTGTEVYLLPPNKKLRVRRLERFGTETEEVVAGDRASMNLTGLSRDDFRRGMIISDRIVPSTRIIDVELRLFRHGRRLPKIWNQVLFHIGTYEQQARVHLIDKDVLNEGDTALAQIHLEYPCIAQMEDRFVIRSTSGDTTLGGGVVIDAHPLHHRRRTEKLRKDLSTIARGGLAERLSSEVNKQPGVTTYREIAERLNAAPEEVLAEISASAPCDIMIYKNGEDVLLVSESRHTDLTERLLRRIAEYHKRNPLDAKGLRLDEMATMLQLERGTPGEGLLKLMVGRLEEQKKIKPVQQTWALFDHSVKLDRDMNRQIQFMEDYLKKCGMKTPHTSELKAAAENEGIREKNLDSILHYLVERKSLYFIDGSYIHSSVVDSSRAHLLAALAGGNKGVTVAEFRDIVKGNRKICLLLLSLYDNEGIVQRSGDIRLLTEKGKELLHAGG